MQVASCLATLHIEFMRLVQSEIAAIEMLSSHILCKCRLRNYKTLLKEMKTAAFWLARCRKETVGAEPHPNTLFSKKRKFCSFDVNRVLKFLTFLPTSSITLAPSGSKMRRFLLEQAAFQKCDGKIELGTINSQFLLLPCIVCLKKKASFDAIIFIIAVSGLISVSV